MIDDRLVQLVEGDCDLPELRSFPQVATQILTACDDPSTSPADLSRIIQCDPSLSVRILRVANSSIYGYSGEIATIERAVVALGFRKMKNIAVSAAAGDVFDGGNAATREHCQKLWLHSLATGAIAGLIAHHRNVNADEAFLAGVVHDVGKLIFLDMLEDKYAAATQDSNALTITQTEMEAFGIDHQQLGERCAEEWGLPAVISSAIACHHEPDNAYDSEDVASIVCVADSLARFLSIGGPSGEKNELEAVLELCNFDASADDLETQIAEPARAAFEVIKAACS